MLTLVWSFDSTSKEPFSDMMVCSLDITAIAQYFPTRNCKSNAFVDMLAPSQQTEKKKLKLPCCGLLNMQVQ